MPDHAMIEVKMPRTRPSQTFPRLAEGQFTVLHHVPGNETPFSYGS